MYEVELKFAVTDPASIIAALAARGAKAEPPVEQVDRYFNHPSRDFVQSHEAFRIRTVGETNAVTYKGPVVDTQTKTRREIELEFAPGSDAAGELADMLTLLGFRAVRAVRKFRTIYRLRIAGRAYEVSFDRVDELGTFVEIETLAEESERAAARDGILSLAAEFGLTKPERRSYLTLLLEKSPCST